MPCSCLIAHTNIARDLLDEDVDQAASDSEELHYKMSSKSTVLEQLATSFSQLPPI